MRLLVLSQYFWPETFRITGVVSALRDAGNEVMVLTGQPNYPDGRIAPGYAAGSLRTETHDGLLIHRVPLVPRGEASAVRLALNYLSFVASAAIFGPWLLRGKRFDAILVYAPSPILQVIPAVLLAVIKRARLVTWVQDLWPDSLSATGFVRSPWLLAAVGRVVRWIYRRNDLLLVQSQAFVEPVKRLGGISRVKYFPNPGERGFSTLDGDTPAAIRLKHGFNVVFAGNLGTAQALETVLSAAELLQHLPDVRFVLVGSGSRSEWLRAEAGRMNLHNIEMPGRFSADQMPGILAQASALLVSLTRNPVFAQTVPSKVQAYLAAGRPIVAAIDGEGARIIEEAGAGIVSSAEDAKALARAVERLREMGPAERAAMGERARAYYARHFEPDMLAHRLTRTLDQLVARGARADDLTLDEAGDDRQE